jgi:hypothetical protein
MHKSPDKSLSSDNSIKRPLRMDVENILNIGVLNLERILTVAAGQIEIPFKN